MKTKSLTPHEYDIIINKDTESPFTGRYTDNISSGIYLCRNCGEALFDSKDKFKATCGWASFDSQIKDNVKKVPDSDGIRTEIVCNNCLGHLGHVFYGEGYTNLDTRYCVNSQSVDFIKDVYEVSHTEEITLAAGCFWGVEYYIKQKEGVLLAESGYCGGNKPYPNYKDVCSGDTDYLESVRVIFDSTKITLEDLLKFYFEIHDFEQTDGQGPDIGSQYKSAIFYYDDKQKHTAETIINLLADQGYSVATSIREVMPFYIAEEYHLDYYNKNQSTPYCHRPRKIF